jgi:carnitine O-acetyltransferase
MDGTPTLRLNEFMLATLASNKVDIDSPRNDLTGNNLAEPKELKFELDCEGMVEGLVKAAEDRFDELIGKHDLHVCVFLYAC